MVCKETALRNEKTASKLTLTILNRKSQDIAGGEARLTVVVTISDEAPLIR